jgi:uncharacterized repeat protein (TIGR03803 family)
VRRRDRHQFRPSVTGLEDRRLLAGYTLAMLASFNGTNGSTPYGNVVLDGQGNLYGTTRTGGIYGDGTVFEVVKGSNTVTTLASFDEANGRAPIGNLAIDDQGNLYGTTGAGGAYGYGQIAGWTSGYGTVFEVANGSNAITTLASFNGYNGFEPLSGVVLDGQGNLYGTTHWGLVANGSYIYSIPGTVYEVVKGSNAITPLASFYGTTNNGTSNGRYPDGGVVLDGQGNLYGTTTGTGSAGDFAALGSVYEVVKGSNTVTTLASFNGLNGDYPLGDLAIDGQGNLYGTASGTNVGDYYGNGGTVFEVAKGSSVITVLAEFDDYINTGVHPYSGVVLDGQGNLYGTTTEDGGAYLWGTVFEVAKGSNAVTTLASFGGDNGSFVTSPVPQGILALDDEGNLYGTTPGGGPDYAGTVFELSPVLHHTSVSLTSDNASTFYGQPVTFTATVSPPTAAGTVTFYDGATALGTGALDATGTATYSTDALTAGAHAITAVYGGDTADAGSTSPVLTQTVAADGTTTTVTSSANPAEFAQPVTFTATVSAAAPGERAPTGSVQLLVDGAPLGPPVSVVDGVAVSPGISTLARGSHTVTAEFTDP